MIAMLLSEAANSLQANLRGADAAFSGCNTDSRTIEAGEMFIALRGERFDGHEYINQAIERGASAAMVDRELAYQTFPTLLVDDTRKGMGRLARRWREAFAIPLIAVTGSNGKTTVKEMLASILSTLAPVLSTKGNLNNDIGVPLTLFGLGDAHRYAVVEMGANHPGEIAWLTEIARPTVALITQCAPAHLQGFGSVAGVAKAKAEIFAGLQDEGIAIINADDKFASLWRTAAAANRQISFGISSAADVSAKEIRDVTELGGGIFMLSAPAGEIEINVPLPGRHNILNALAAAACCLAIDIPLASIKSGLEQMQAVKGRMQLKRGRNGARLYDDTYNANPASLEAALKVLNEQAGRRWLVLGDMGELGEMEKALHHRAGELARQYGIERLYTLGQLSQEAVAGFGKQGRHFNREQDLIDVLQKGLDQDITLLIKGSRAMSMERIVAALVEED